MTKTKFVLEGSPEFEGWDVGMRWNGWACPAFDEEQAAALAAWWNEQPECSATFESVDSSWAFDCEEWPEPEFYLPERSGDLTVWLIGAENWCWNRAGDP